MFQKYSLEIVSHHRDFNNKTMRQYHVDGINTVGVYGDEPFEVRFKNHTSSKVQVKLSIDGTDLLTGEKATTDISKDMWAVQAYGTLNLKAWPESQNGGAALIFTSASNSVAVHTHGDLSSRGIIAAAVFEEGNIPLPERFVEKHVHHYHYPNYYWLGGSYTVDLSEPIMLYNNSSIGSYGSNQTFSSSAIRSADINCSTESLDSSVTSNSVETKSLQNLAAVGAGQYTDQKITYTAGLIKPSFTESVRVRYLWWDELTAKLRSTSYAEAHGSGFPGDKPTGIKLGKTPRIGNYGDAFPKQAAQAFARF